MKRVLIIFLLIFLLYGCEEEVQRLAIPSELTENQGVITFDPVENADYYVIEINGVEYQINQTSYTISEVGSYEVRVKAVSDTLPDSFFTDKILFTMTKDFGSVNYTYSIHSTFDLMLTMLSSHLTIDEVFEGDQVVNPSHYSLIEQSVYFESEFLQTLSIGEHTFTFTLNFGTFEATINMIDTTRPYMISHSEIHTSLNQDVNVIFELFGGEVISLSGNGITAGDYTINDSTVTIDHTFIENAFTVDPSRETLIIGYTLERGLDMVIGYIFIYPNT